MQKPRVAGWWLSSLGVVALALTAWAGVAAAASGGGFNPDQNDCAWNADAWNTPPDTVPPGCHDFAANVETGGTTNGDPDSGNTRFAELGVDQSPNDPGNPGFGYEEYVGDPGTPDSPHSGCLAANTDGTGGGTSTGCGSNPDGSGFEANYDYDALYCAVSSTLPTALFPTPALSLPDPTGDLGPLDGPSVYQCTSDLSPSQAVTVTPDNGSQNALSEVAGQGLLVSVGAFDNLDDGEHDGFSGANNTGGAINGPSDGGGLLLSLTPQSALNMPSFTNPEGLLNLSEGECADSICSETTTQQQTVYDGCVEDGTPPANGAPQNNGTNGGNNWNEDDCAPGTPQSTNVYENNTPASTEESYGCNGGGPTGTETACYTNQDGTSNPDGADGYRQNTPSQVNAEPGVQTYQDPDPQRSPALPFATPGLYAGTCGAYVDLDSGDGVPGILSYLTDGATPSQDGYLGPSNC